MLITKSDKIITLVQFIMLNMSIFPLLFYPDHLEI